MYLGRYDIVKLINKGRYNVINRHIRKNKVRLDMLLAIGHEYSRFDFFKFLDFSLEEVAKTIISGSYRGHFGDFERFMIDVGKDISIEALVPDDIAERSSSFIVEFAAIAARHNLQEPKIYELAEAVVEEGTAQYIYEFALKVKRAPINYLKQAIIKTNNAEYILKFAKHIKSESKMDLIEAFVNSEDAIDYIESFVNWVVEEKNIFISDVTNKVAETNNVDLIIAFACCLAKNIEYISCVVTLAKAIVKMKNSAAIYRFIKEVPNALIDDLIQAIIDLEDIKYICLLIKEYNNLSIENLSKLFKAVMKAFTITKDAPIDRLEEVLANLVRLGIFDETSLKRFISYLAFEKEGKLIEPYQSVAEIPNELFIGGNQYVKVQNTQNTQTDN